MFEVSTKQRELYISLNKSQAEAHTSDTIITYFGKHFLSQIKKLEDDSVFDKINQIESKELNQEDEQKIKQDIEFYTAKVRNLTQRLKQNNNDMEDKDEYELYSEMRNLEMQYKIHQMQQKYNDSIWDKDKIDFELKALKEYYNS